jgi:WD40 repeat protein
MRLTNYKLKWLIKLSYSFLNSYLLTNSMDNTMRIWDVRPFAPANRCMKVFTGHSHGFEKYLLKCAWSKDGQRVASGSSDRFVYVWDTNTRQIQYRLPGHDGTVTAVDLHPDEPICKSIYLYLWVVLLLNTEFILCVIGLITFLFFIFISAVLSAGADKQIYLGEIEDTV